MATDNNIKTFSALDIEKYHKGLLSSKEMNAMEKAALDDPFLADALEGYAVPGVHAAADIAELQKRLAAKTESTKVVAMYAEKKKPFMWWRVAAAVVLIGGAAVLASQFLTKSDKQGELATVTTTKENKEQPLLDSGNINTVTNTGNSASPASSNDEYLKNTDRIKSSASETEKDIDGDRVQDETAKLRDAETARTEDNPKPGTVIPAPVATENRVDAMAKSEREELKKEMAKTEVKQKDAAAIGGAVNDDLTKRKAVAAAPAKKMDATDARNRYQQPNIFRGRITDANNTGLPFAKVYNPADNNAGTYTDANGYFTLTYPDSALTVQVKAIGFENANVQIQNNRNSNNIVMQDDRSLSEVVVSRQMPNTNSRSVANNQMNRKLEEPEPADGWAKYDAYLANNLEAPEEIKTTERNMSGYVQVSFEVDKNGEPVNITVEKSLCAKCDKEAVRLVKEGPKWKRSANKHGRTTVTINF